MRGGEASEEKKTLWRARMGGNNKLKVVLMLFGVLGGIGGIHATRPCYAQRGEKGGYGEFCVPQNLPSPPQHDLPLSLHSFCCHFIKLWWVLNIRACSHTEYGKSWERGCARKRPNKNAPELLILLLWRGGDVRVSEHRRKVVIAVKSFPQKIMVQYLAIFNIN